jgi:hypothetical protein
MPDEIPKTVVKDVAVCNWVPVWDPKDYTSIVSFFKKIEAAAQMGGLTDKDRILMVRMKLRGAPKTYLKTHPELQEDSTYDRLKAILIEIQRKASRRLLLWRFQCSSSVAPSLFSSG